MGPEILQAVGGLGLFLLGMSLMTEGLKSLADDRLRQILARSTNSPISGVFTGAITTAIIQSSSATTVAAVGLVHVGLLTFAQALGVIFGANIGTTITGWMVALIGFKWKIGEIMLPLVLLGALIRLLAQGKLRWMGTSLAGFGLIFVGISALQDGMSAFQGVVTPDSFPSDTLWGRVLLVLLGVIITVITQSSSAGVATALAAVHADAMTLHQAAAMVIGMNIGTTATAIVATIGGNVQARRTGFAHVIFNVITGLVAFFLLTPYFWAMRELVPEFETAEPELALTSFHTFFNVLGVILFLPLTGKFVQLLEWMFPERGNPLAKRLDLSLLVTPDLALQAVQATNYDVLQTLLGELSQVIDQPDASPSASELADVDDALAKTREFLDRLRIQPEQAPSLGHLAQTIHVIDHLYRIRHRLDEAPRISRIRDDQSLETMADLLATLIDQVLQAELPYSAEVTSAAQQLNQDLKADMRGYRIEILQHTAAGELSSQTALQRTDSARWIRRQGYHLWRIVDHLSESPIERGE
ncbi:Na/Pi cotransporter family protein [Blastopirellula marina]|uniref:Na/Pi cotransporter family protein n=1 Tax=Blastopirellula marina TaxID=124 RepID=A0A2S8G3S7_9BACT|nr:MULTISPECIES: Na/Pi symporter [Pirellulaceae]PQO39109.1 Na/Pi cotransporter family protein [Blastopirellula marina]RCS55417.1 Na/Pi cotransporter family protein [Bremerella cremea]